MIEQAVSRICGKEEKGDQVLYVDGHKVTVRFSAQENPQAAKAIKKILVANILTANG